MKETFDKIIEFTLKCEGGYVNDPLDPGGETNMGISKRSHPDVDIANLTKEQAREIYYKEYWKQAGCEQLKWPLDAVVFDCAVNCGIELARSFLHRSDDWTDHLMARLRYYAKLELFHRYGRGWIRRVINLYEWIIIENRMVTK